MSKQSDFELIGALCVELGDRYISISNLLKGNNTILKHLAAASIHTALFMADLANDLTDDVKDKIDNEMVDKFLESCGCKDFKLSKE